MAKKEAPEVRETPAPSVKDAVAGFIERLRQNSTISAEVAAIIQAQIPKAFGD